MKGIAQRILDFSGKIRTDLRRDDGFTLLEIMIVIVIIGILSLIVIPRFMDIPQKARVEAAKQQIASFGLALERYNLDNAVYPTTEQGLRALVEKPTTEPIPMNYNEGGYAQEERNTQGPLGQGIHLPVPRRARE